LTRVVRNGNDACLDLMDAPARRPWYRSLAREPLVHFLVAGLALAGLEALARPEAEPADTRVLEIGASVRRGLAEDWAHDHGAPPTEAELDARLEAWLDEELLYREGLLRGLDRDDPRVRARVATITASLLEAEHPIPEPDDEALRAFFEAHLDRYAEEARYDFTQVFVAGTDEGALARAAALLAELEAGASPIAMGDTYPGGRHYRGRRLADLAQAFGPAFVAGFADVPDGRWSLHRSDEGLHLVRIESRTAASPADFERARADVEHDLLEDARAERTRAALRALRARWQVLER
jgi:hypothetical protein